jgi:dipeptidase E
VIEPIRERVAAGLPYIGWSAGSVVAGPTIATTNDMPIVEPPSLAALALVPFHINAHYTDFHPPDHQGETRAERLTEFLAANPAERVVALREGAMIRVEGSNATRLGDTGALLFEREREAAEWSGEPIRRASA